MIRIWDSESDNLVDKATKLHCICWKSLDSDVVAITDNFKQQWDQDIQDGDVPVCHNQVGHDFPLLEKLHGTQYGIQEDIFNDKKVTVIDTYVLSTNWYPDLPSHGLEAWGERLGIKKPEITSWTDLTQEEYVHRCSEDVHITQNVYEFLCGKLGLDPGNPVLPFHLKLAHKTYDLMQQQERYGVLFDQEKARELVVRIDNEMEAIRSEVEPKLPTRPLNKTELKKYTPPAKQFLKTGEPSAATLKWFDRVDRQQSTSPFIVEGELPYFGWKDGKAYQLPFHEPIIKSLPMTLGNQVQIKDWLLSLGWKPTLWNFKKDSKGKPVRDEHNQLIKTSPKFHEQGRICENLEKLGDKIELVKPIITWLSLRNRRSVLLNEEKGTGWLNHPRLKVDGRLPASSSGLTNTKRQKHRVVANVPKVTSLLGEEFRSLFIAPEGKCFVGYDASGLEARNEASRSYPYDGGVYARELLEGDIHAKNAIVFGTTRDGAKSPKYAITYGCSAPKLAGLLDVPVQRAKELIDDYWESNYAVARHREALEREWKESGKKYITGIAGDKIVVRSPHSLLNCDLQNMGAKIMDLAGWFMTKWVKHKNIPANRVVYYHDEYIWECAPEDAELIAKLGIESIKKAGEYFKLNVPLDAEAKIGYNWAEVH